jgi:hypothetical protein
MLHVQGLWVWFLLACRLSRWSVLPALGGELLGPVGPSPIGRLLAFDVATAGVFLGSNEADQNAFPMGGGFTGLWPRKGRRV